MQLPAVALHPQASTPPLLSQPLPAILSPQPPRAQVPQPQLGSIQPGSHTLGPGRQFIPLTLQGHASTPAVSLHPQGLGMRPVLLPPGNVLPAQITPSAAYPRPLPRPQQQHQRPTAPDTGSQTVPWLQHARTLVAARALQGLAGSMPPPPARAIPPSKAAPVSAAAPAPRPPAPPQQQQLQGSAHVQHLVAQLQEIAAGHQQASQGLAGLQAPAPPLSWQPGLPSLDMNVLQQLAVIPATTPGKEPSSCSRH